MNIAYIDCVGGVSGDMLLGALIDLGVDPERLRETIKKLHLDNCDLRTDRVLKGTLSTIQVSVITPQNVIQRKLSQLLTILEESDLERQVKNQAVSIIQRLAEVESKIHKESLEDVHLHELGGDDTIIDIACVLVGLRELNIGGIFASSIPLGHGLVNSAHGMLPLPAPATLALLEGCPVRFVDEEAELVTPTGAVLLVSIVEKFGSFPSMKLKKIGYGAGQRELSFPNILRIWLGTTPDLFHAKIEDLVIIETNIDDMNPQAFASVMDHLFQEGALDVWLTPIQMKKNRPATSLSILSVPEKYMDLSRILFEETTTIGLRKYVVDRLSLPRTLESIDTPYGSIRFKSVQLPSGIVRCIPEYEDCLKVAEAHGESLVSVIEKIKLIINDKK